MIDIQIDICINWIIYSLKQLISPNHNLPCEQVTASNKTFPISESSGINYLVKLVEDLIFMKAYHGLILSGALGYRWRPVSRVTVSGQQITVLSWPWDAIRGNTQSCLQIQFIPSMSLGLHRYSWALTTLTKKELLGDMVQLKIFCNGTYKVDFDLFLESICLCWLCFVATTTLWYQVIS